MSSGVVSGTTVRALVTGRFGQKNKNNKFERYGQRTNKNISNYIAGLVLWAADVCFLAAFAQLGPVSSISLGQFFLVRVKRNVTLLSVSICPRVSSIIGILFKKEWSYG